MSERTPGRYALVIPLSSEKRTTKYPDHYGLSGERRGKIPTDDTRNHFLPPSALLNGDPIAGRLEIQKLGCVNGDGVGYGSCVGQRRSTRLAGDIRKMTNSH
jgi:hypothetical protein